MMQLTQPTELVVTRWTTATDSSGRTIAALAEGLHDDVAEVRLAGAGRIGAAGWSAPAVVRSRAGRASAAVEVSICPWRDGAVEVTVRPRHPRPWALGARRQRTYFDLAHGAAALVADHLAAADAIDTRSSAVTAAA